MATKNNPGKYDCYTNAEPDEPMFILLGRDKHAPLLVKLWAEMRALDGEDPGKVAEAVHCADAMRIYRLSHRNPVTPEMRMQHHEFMGGDATCEDDVA